MADTPLIHYQRFLGTARSAMVEEDATFETRIKGCFLNNMGFVNTLLKWWYTENGATMPTGESSSIPDDVAVLYWHAGAASACMDVLRSPELADGHESLFEKRLELLLKLSGQGKTI